MNWEMVAIEEFLIQRRGSVNPAKYSDETFELYSIPAYDNGKPEVLRGAEIGSSKKKIEKGDVLLSRIVPHIRRSWVIEKESKYRMIGSGEWIVFNSPRIDPHYLKYFFFSDWFSKQYLKDLTGVGGSLMRAKPAIAGKIQIPLPPLPIQRQIAHLLDTATALRRKTEAQLEELDRLAEATFLELFGDPVLNEKGWDVVRLGEVCTKITDGTHHSPPPVEKGVHYITAKHVRPFRVDFASRPTFVSAEHHQEIYSRCNPELGDVLYIKDGATTGAAAVNPFDFEFSMLSSLALIKPNQAKLNSHYLTYWLNNEVVKNNMLRNLSGAAIKRFTLRKIKQFKISLPEVTLQTHFARLIENIEAQKKVLRQSVQEAEDLVGCLLQDVFGNGRSEVGNRE